MVSNFIDVFLFGINYGGKKMKRIFEIVLLFIILLAVSKETHGTAMVMLGQNIHGKEEFAYDDIYDSGNIENNIISFTYVRKIRFTITNQFGEFYGEDEKNHMKSLDIMVGYPLFCDNKGLLYFTLTGFKYSGYQDSILNTHEADGGLIGFEVVGVPNDKTQFELGWHGAIGGSYRVNSDNLALKMMLIRFKIQYLLTDDLGLVIYCESKDFNNRDLTFNRFETINNTYLGFIYRL